MKHCAAALIFSTAFAGTALANDSTAELGAGGIFLVYADSISMDKEELFISKDEVRVDYVFRNTEDKPHTYLVAFPMPEIEAPGYLESDIGVPDREKDNFMNVSVTVAGKAVEPKLEMRALTGGIDVTDKIAALGIPLNPLAAATHDAINKLPRGKLVELITMGALRVYEDTVDAQWTLRTNYYWLQLSPPMPRCRWRTAIRPPLVLLSSIRACSTTRTTWRDTASTTAPRPPLPRSWSAVPKTIPISPNTRFNMY